jgi:ketosteroid isomerase-like protein
VSEQANVALVQKVFEAFGRGDTRTILDLCTSDSEFYSPGPEIIPYAGRKKGRSEIQTYFDSLLSTQRNANLSIDEYVAQGNKVVAIGRYRAEVSATGKAIDTTVMLGFWIENGKIARHLVLGDSAAVAECYRAASAAAG